MREIDGWKKGLGTESMESIFLRLKLAQKWQRWKEREMQSNGFGEQTQQSESCMLPFDPVSPGLKRYLLRLSLPAQRRAVHCDPAGGDVARHRGRHEVSVGHELRAPRPGRPQHPGQQQPGEQGVGLRPVALPGGRRVRPHLHQRPGECLTRRCRTRTAASTVFLRMTRMESQRI